MTDAISDRHKRIVVAIVHGGPYDGFGWELDMAPELMDLRPQARVYCPQLEQEFVLVGLSWSDGLVKLEVEHPAEYDRRRLRKEEP